MGPKFCAVIALVVYAHMAGHLITIAEGGNLDVPFFSRVNNDADGKKAHGSEYFSCDMEPKEVGTGSRKRVVYVDRNITHKYRGATVPIHQSLTSSGFNDSFVEVMKLMRREALHKATSQTMRRTGVQWGAACMASAADLLAAGKWCPGSAAFARYYEAGTGDRSTRFPMVVDDPMYKFWRWTATAVNEPMAMCLPPVRDDGP